MSIEAYPSQNGVLTSLIWRKTMSGGETSLSGYDNASQALSYTPGQEQVYLNGILLVRGDDYTATNGTSITGLSALAASDFIQVNCYNNFSVASLPTSGLTGTISNAQLQNSAITINGSAVSLGGSTTIAGGSAQDSEPVSPVEGQLWLDTNGTVSTTAFVEKSTISAKGDLYVGTANDTVGILSTTENGATLVADSSTSTGLRYTDGTVQANPVLNSAFQIAQRGTSISLAASTQAYTLDRWQTSSGVNQACTIARVATGDTTNLPNIQYAMRYQRNSGQTGTGGQSTYQSMESVNSIPYSGKTVTISVYARAGANYSAASSILQFNLVNGTGTDQSIYSGLTGQNTVSSNNMTLTTTWQRFTYTGTIPTNSTQLAIGFGFQFSGTAGANDYFEVTGVQIDVGSVALPFRTNAGTIQQELAACQRYYWRHTAGTNGVTMAMGISESATTNWVPINNVVPLRVPATSLDINGLNCTDAVSFTTAVGSATITSASTLMTRAVFNTSGQTAKQAIFITSQSSASYIGVSAEL